MSNQYSTIAYNLAQLKNYYQGPIIDQFNEEVAIYRATEKVRDQWSGQKVVKPLKVRRNNGIGATSDGGLLPAIGRQTTIAAEINAKFNYLRFGITGPMIKSSANDKGSFVRSAAYELEEGYKDLKSDVNRQLSWDGTGYLATVSANAVGSNVITVTGRESTENGSKFLDVGMVIDVVTTGGTIVASGVSITAMSGTTTATLTLSAAVTVSSTDKVIRSGSQNNEIQGLLTQLDGGTSTVFAIDRASYPITQGNEIEPSGGSTQLTIDYMQQAWNAGLSRGGNGYSAIWTSFEYQRYYQKLLTADKRYVNSIKGDGGFGSKDKMYLDFNGVAIVPDKDCPQRMFFLPVEVIKSYVLCEMEFADETGSMYIAATENDALEGRIRFFMNLFNEKASACAVLNGFTSP